MLNLIHGHYQEIPELPFANVSIIWCVRLARRGGQTDEIHVLDYEGLSFKIYRVKEVPPRDLVFELTITDNRFLFKWGLRMGSPRDEVVRALGKPDKDGPPLTFSTETGVASFFFSKENRLEKVQWQWDID